MSLKCIKSDDGQNVGEIYDITIDGHVQLVTGSRHFNYPWSDRNHWVQISSRKWKYTSDYGNWWEFMADSDAYDDMTSETVIDCDIMTEFDKIIF